jgi:hypothetical protein
MFNNAYKMLVNHEKSQSIASKIISLQIYILEQEQIARLINVCSIMFNIKPENLDQKQNIDVKNSEIEKVLLKMNNANRDSFWSLFPKEWKAPIQNYKFVMIETPKTDVELNSILTQFNTRIGSLIYNFSKQSIKKNIQNEDIVNNLNIIHYILPCIVYSFAYEFKKENKVSLYINWVKEMIEQYENSSIDDKGEKKKGKEGFSVECMLEFVALNDCMNYCFNRNMGFVSALAENVGFLGKMIHINSCFLEWTFDFREPEDYSNDDFKTFNELVVFLMKYQYQSHEFINNMYESSQGAFDVPLYDMCFEDKNVELGEMYFATIILLELSLMYSATMKHPDNSSIAHPGNSSNEHPTMSEIIFLKANDALKKTDMSIFSHAMFTDSAFKKEIRSDFDYKSFYIKHTKVLYDFYQTIKKFCERNGPPEQYELPHMFLHPFSLNYDSDVVEDGVRAFLEGDFDEFEEHIKVFKHLQGTSHKVNFKSCKNCSEINFYHLLIACEKCIEQKVPEVHYYCSKKCKDIKWESEHQDFHLKLDIAMALFTALNVN